MSALPPRPRVPRVNLLDPPRRGFRPPIPARYLEVTLIAFVVLVWVVAALGIALLLGWRPQRGLGP